MPFYSSAQRRYYFAVIAPMRQWGFDFLSGTFLDPLATAVGWEPLRQQEETSRLEKALGDTKLFGIFTENEKGELEEFVPSLPTKDKMLDILTDVLDETGVMEEIWKKIDAARSDKHLNAIASLFGDVKQIGKKLDKITPRYSQLRPNAAERSETASDYTGDGAWGYPRKKTKNGKQVTEQHAGVDINASPNAGSLKGVGVPSPVEGTVVFVGQQNAADLKVGYGKMVEILGKDGRIRRFAHLDGWNVAIGDEVRAGQTIGKVGNTGASRGAHLHFELRENYLRHREGGKDVPIPYKKVSGMREDTLRRLTSRSGATLPKGLSVGDRAGFDSTLNPEAEAKIMQDAMRRKERTRILLGAALDGFLKQGAKAAKAESKAAQKTAKPAGAAARPAKPSPKKSASGKKPAAPKTSAPKTPAKKQASAKPAGTKPAAKSKTAAVKKAPKQLRQREAQ